MFAIDWLKRLQMVSEPSQTTSSSVLVILEPLVGLSCYKWYPSQTSSSVSQCVSEDAGPFGRLKLLQMVSEPDIKRCVSEDTGPQRGGF